MQTTSLTLGGIVFPKAGNDVLALIRGAALAISLALITGVAANVKIEAGFVPVTLQTLVVLMSGVLFGSRIGVSSQATYLFAGLAGVPWFSRGGGAGYLFSPTFGYIIGFVAAAYAVGFLAERGWDKTIGRALGAMTIGTAIIYFFGLIWLAKFAPFGSLLTVGVYPFLAGDLLKITIASLVLPQCWKHIGNRRRFEV
jgi:biotin transport system substrate-specific component